jgi:membrane-associated phospholipid phosphatase
VSFGYVAVSCPPVARLRERYDRQLSWLLRRLAPSAYLGLHLTLGLLVVAGCLWLFGGITEDILNNDPLVQFDERVETILHERATPTLTAFFLVVTALGSLEAIGILGLIVAVIFGVRHQWLSVGAWLAALAGGVILNQLLKEVFARPRPYFEHPLALETSYSFPSGHATMSLICYGMLAYYAVLALQSWRAKAAAIFGAAFLVLLIGFSRVYLGVHYFSDVAGGFASAGVWLSVLITGSETIRRRSKVYSAESRRGN